MKLNYKRTIFVGFAFFLICAFWQSYDAIVPLILTNHFGLDHVWSGAVMAADNVLAVFLLPIFGALSDKVMTKIGKRTPFIIVGTALAVVFFIGLSFADSAQLPSIMETEMPGQYESLYEEREDLYEKIDQAYAEGKNDLVEDYKKDLDRVEDDLEELSNKTFEMTKSNIAPFVWFIVLLMLVLLSMAIFRSPAVALMPDVTVKPLRSKGNAIINLMGTAGGVVVIGLGMVFGTGAANPYKDYRLYIAAVSVVMVIGLVVFLCTVKENKWAQEMQVASLELEKDEEDSGTENHRKLSKSELFSLFMILASVALWYIGYNSVTTKYSVYATRELGFDFNLPLLIAQVAAIIAYIPIGMISSKVGRKKAILAGVAMLATAFFLGHFITPIVPEVLMYLIFILAGIGWATINVNSFPMVVELAKGSDIGKYTGYYYTASMAAQIVAPTLSGIFYEKFGMRDVFFVFATVFVVLSFITMLFVKHGDSKPEKQDALEALAGAED